MTQADEPEAFTRARHEAEKLADELAQRIPSLQVDVLGARDLAEVVVEVDGQPIPNATIGLPRKSSVLVLKLRPKMMISLWPDSVI